MPVPTTIETIRLLYPPVINSHLVLTFISKIILKMYNRTTIGGVVQFEMPLCMLLCKSLLNSYDIHYKTLHYSKMMDYFQRNGTPISLDDDFLKIENHENFDGLGILQIVQEDVRGNPVVFLSFSKEKGTRRLYVEYVKERQKFSILL